MMRPTTALASFAVGAFALMTPDLARAGGISGFPAAVAEGDAISADAHGAHPLGGSFYLESWDLAFRFKSNHFLYVSFLGTNIGSKGRGGLIAFLVNPNGSTTSFRHGRKSGDWSAGQSLDVSVGDARLSGTPARSTLTLKNEAAEISLTLSNAVNAIRPGRAQLDSSVDDFFDLTITGPRVRATGTLKPVNGDEVSLSGEGFSRHSHTQVPTHKLFRSWMTTTGLWRNLTFYLTMIHTPKGLGSAVVPFLAVFDGEKLVLGAVDGVDVRYFGYRRDNLASGKFRVPRGFRFAYSDKKTGMTVSGRVEQKKLVHRFDVLENLNKFDRFIVERFQKPVQYRQLVRWKLELTQGKETKKASGEGLSEYNFLN
ncbi:MAG: hypothetical protein HYY84_17790 [Deltaproteobacteria bacterium]|nr:hypothetical protein [Deltaproteobacteria bacterium]